MAPEQTLSCQSCAAAYGEIIERLNKSMGRLIDIGAKQADALDRAEMLRDSAVAQADYFLQQREVLRAVLSQMTIAVRETRARGQYEALITLAERLVKS